MNTQSAPVETSGSYTDINATDLASMLENKNFLLVNVSSPYQSEITGTDLFIPHNEIASSLSRLPSDKNSKLVVYCMVGAMSADTSKVLVSLGYTNVWNLSGGMLGWKQAGYPLVTRSAGKPPPDINY